MWQDRQPQGHWSDNAGVLLDTLFFVMLWVPLWYAAERLAKWAESEVKVYGLMFLAGALLTLFVSQPSACHL